MSIDPTMALEIQRRALHDFVLAMSGSAPGSRAIELRGGVTGAIVPAAADRSIVNSVTYRDPDALLEGLDELAAVYVDAGVHAWTVWVPDCDEEVAASLRAAGHTFDGKPLAMVLDLAELDAEAVDDPVWDEALEPDGLGAVNDEAYGLPEGDGIGPAFHQRPQDVELRLYRALVEDEIACVLGTIDHVPVPGAAGPDCGVYFVAVPPRFRRRGLARRLMVTALREARDRGCATSSLQSSAMGEAVYLGLGYRPYFRLHLYERRADQLEASG